jgi:trk system potassium uptake protein TrkH
MMKKDKKIVSGYPLILNYLGIFAVLIGIIIIIPTFYILFNYSELEFLKFFLVPAVISIIIGSLIVLYFRGREKGHLERHQDAVLVVSIWLLAIFVSSFPFMLTGQFNFTQSVFEVTSGYSTTGFTIVDVEQIPKIFLLYRSWLQFIGGVGLVLVLMSAISDKYGMRLYSAEGHNDKLMPNLVRSARMILSIYVIYIIVGTLSYILFGMPIFDAINHSISSVATGGFSTKYNSIGHFNSLGIEIVSMVLMILGGTNFFVHLLLFRGKFKSAVKHIEIKFLFILTILIIPLFTFSLISVGQMTFGNALRHGTFHFFTTITTTGLQIIPSVNNFPVSIMFLTLILMMIGAGIGSTAGGMKLYRVAVSLKGIGWSVKESLTHRKFIRTHFVNRFGNKTIIEKDEISQVNVFILIYLLILIAGIFIFTLYGASLSDAIFEFTSILGTIGLSVGLISYSSPLPILWTGIVGMLIARLESIVIINAIFKVMIDLTKRKPH